MTPCSRLGYGPSLQDGKDIPFPIMARPEAPKASQFSFQACRVFERKRSFPQDGGAAYAGVDECRFRVRPGSLAHGMGG